MRGVKGDQKELKIHARSLEFNDACVKYYPEHFDSEKKYLEYLKFH